MKAIVDAEGDICCSLCGSKLTKDSPCDCNVYAEDHPGFLDLTDALYKQELFKKSIRKWGINHQLVKLAEEATELAQTCLKLYFAKRHLDKPAYQEFFKQLAEESFDVTFLLDEVKYYYETCPDFMGDNPESLMHVDLWLFNDWVNHFKKQKMKRLECLLFEPEKGKDVADYFEDKKEETGKNIENTCTNCKYGDTNHDVEPCRTCMETSSKHIAHFSKWEPQP